MSLETKEQETTRSVLYITIALVCYIGFLSQCVLAAKLILVDKEFATLALCLVFAVLFAVIYVVVSRKINWTKPLWIVQFSLGSAAGLFSCVLLGVLYPQHGIGIGVGLLCWAIACSLPAALFISSRIQAKNP